MLPLWNVTPKWLKPILKKILKMKYSWIHKTIYTLTFPLIDFDEFIVRIKEMPHMIMQTRRALKNDFWDEDYVDAGFKEIESDIIKTNENAKIADIKTPENLIPDHVIAKQKLEKEIKDKRRKAHFFHGRIKFDKAN